MNRIEFEKIVRECKSKSQVALALDYKINGYGLKRVNELIVKYGVNIDHFDTHWYHREKKYEVITKECPVCGDEFTTKKGHKREKTTCSRRCSNTHFRSGSNHGNWKEETYRTTCFEYHKKECVVCGENKIVEVHHYDGNHDNNKKENLVPLCPTHHRYWHSRYRNLIKEVVDVYVKNFIKKNQ